MVKAIPLNGRMPRTGSHVSTQIPFNKREESLETRERKHYMGWLRSRYHALPEVCHVPRNREIFIAGTPAGASDLCAVFIFMWSLLSEVLGHW